MPNLLPPSATELSRALDQLAERRLDQPLPHRHSWNPWHCRADLLGPLAWGLGVDNWDNLMTEQARRQACADAIHIHRLRGTVDSVERAIRAAGYENIELEEGLPPVTHNGQQLRNGHELYGSGGRWAMYRANVNVGDHGTISAAGNRRLRRILEKTAPARCQLVGLRFSDDTSDRITTVERVTEQAAITGGEVLPWGSRRDGAINRDQAIVLHHQGSIARTGAQRRNGGLITGETRANQWDALSLTMGVSHQDTCRVSPLRTGTHHRYGLHRGAGSQVADDGLLALTFTRTLRRNGRAHHRCTIHSGQLLRAGAHRHHPGITRSGPSITTEVTP
ncbi:phage tail protein I [Aeromonas caviae]|uniref:phage tail protein I n=1 Tax=Aeromonas caviae TaxID=648 RepID=UPI002E24E1C3|nr:phage tail protein I [Aeromonas caviae]